MKKEKMITTPERLAFRIGVETGRILEIMDSLSIQRKDILKMKIKRRKHKTKKV